LASEKKLLFVVSVGRRMDHEREERVAAAGERDGARFGMGQTSRRFIEEEVDHWPSHPCTADVECSDGQPYEEESDVEVSVDMG
jgi:hypothetical protein